MNAIWSLTLSVLNKSSSVVSVMQGASVVAISETKWANNNTVMWRYKSASLPAVVFHVSATVESASFSYNVRLIEAAAGAAGQERLGVENSSSSSHMSAGVVAAIVVVCVVVAAVLVAVAVAVVVYGRRKSTATHSATLSAQFLSANANS